MNTPQTATPLSGALPESDVTDLNARLCQLVKFFNEEDIPINLARLNQMIDQEILPGGPSLMHAMRNSLWHVVQACAPKPHALCFVEALLKAGMDPALCGEKHGLNGFHLACTQGIELLARYCKSTQAINATADADNLYRTPLLARLHSDSSYGKTRPHRLEEFLALLRLGADPNIRDINGQTALHMIVRMTIDDELKSLMVKRLIDAGADVNAPGEQGQTPIGALCKGYDGSSCPLTMKTMLDHGAKPSKEAGQLIKIARRAVWEGDAPLLLKAIELGLSADCRQNHERAHLLAFDAARDINRIECLKVMLENGWDPMDVDDVGENLMNTKFINEQAKNMVLSFVAAKEAKAAMKGIRP